MKSQQIIGVLEIQVSFSEIVLDTFPKMLLTPASYLDQPRNSEASASKKSQCLSFISFVINLPLTISLIIFAL